jgi:alpha-mannosidase
LWREDAPNTHPFHGWCAVEGSTSRSWEPADRGPELAAAEFTAAPSAAAGIAVFSRGLPEYQLLRQDEASFLAVTLFRSVSRVHARGSLTIDRRAWGIPFRTPLAQCTGRHQFDLAIHPFSGSWAHAGVDHTAESFVFDYACLQIPPEKPAREGAAGAVVPPHEVEPVVAHVDQSGILMSSLKMAESGHGVIVRFWNNRDAEREVHIRVSGRFSAADRCDLREQPVEQCAINRASAPASDGAPADVPGGVVTIAFGPWEIVTLRLS